MRNQSKNASLIGSYSLVVAVLASQSISEMSGSVVESFCKVLIEMDYCTVVIQLLNTVVVDSTVQLLTGILWKVSLDESSRVHVTEGVDAIVHSLQTYPTHAGIQRNCLGVLFNLSLSGK